MKSKIFSSISVLGVLLLVSACGVEEGANSDLDGGGPASIVYSYNGSGTGNSWPGGYFGGGPIGGPITGKFLTQTGENGFLNWSATSNIKAPQPGCVVFGPYLNLQPGPSGIGHFNAEVDLNLSLSGRDWGGVTVDLVSNSGTIVYDSVTLTSNTPALAPGEFFSLKDATIKLRGTTFNQPVLGVEVRVCIGGFPRPGFEDFPSISLKVSETRVIYN